LSRLAEAVIDTVADPIFVKDDQLRFVMVNQAFSRFFGKMPHEMIGRKGGEFLTPEMAAEFEANERAVLESGTLYEVEEEFEFQNAPGARVVRKHRVTPASGKDYLACTI